MNNLTSINEIVARNNAILQKNQKLLHANYAILKRYRELSQQIPKKYTPEHKKKQSF